MGVGYRVRQFWQTLRARPLSETAVSDIETILTPTEMALFRQFPSNDQQHSYQVMQTLWQAGHREPLLLKAGLLHDIGKVRAPLFIWDRVLIVLAKWLFPDKTAVWGQGEAKGWKRPFVVKAKHPEWGAEMVQAVDGETLLVSLIRRHQDTLAAPPQTKEEEFLAQLQWADDQN